MLILLAIPMKFTLSQELMLEVRVTAPSIEGTDRTVFEDMQRALYEFINNRKWTNVNIRNSERIEGSLLITIKERVSSDEYKASINLVLRRPTYKTSYNTVLLNHVDENFTFKYIESQAMDYSDNTYMSELTSVMAFYVYYCLGLDFDTFSLYGGDVFFRAAEAVVNSAQGATVTGWKAFDGNKNRYWLAENMTNQVYRPLRQFMYNYHRLGLDIMSEKPDEGRAVISESLNLLQQMYKERPGLLFLQLILDAKRDELINIYSSKSSSQEKTKAVNILREIDASNSSKYEKILQSSN